MVIPRSFSSGALSMESKLRASLKAFVSQNLRDRCGQCGLAVVNVADGSDVDVGLGALRRSPLPFPVSD
jgi:hypothetical protein